MAKIKWKNFTSINEAYLAGRAEKPFEKQPTELMKCWHSAPAAAAGRLCGVTFRLGKYAAQMPVELCKLIFTLVWGCVSINFDGVWKPLQTRRTRSLSWEYMFALSVARRKF